MGTYTEFYNTEAQTLSLEDDQFEKKLLEIASHFRGFDEALTNFIEKHGYTGDIYDISAKANFICEKFELSNIEVPRNIKGWFAPIKKLDRNTVFKLCFAFGLDIEETNEFFRCVRYDRSFDCHTINEAVYYFCMKNNLSYIEAQEIINCIPVLKKIKNIPNHEVLYTKNIINYIDSIDDKNHLIQYIKDNINDFQYNNATAIKYIQELWIEISKEDGLAMKEGYIINQTYNRFENKHKKGVADTRSVEVIASEVYKQEQEIKPYDYAVTGPDASTWTIFSQIMGMTNYQKNEYSNEPHGYSLGAVLSKNKLLPLKADYCFPSRQNIDKLMRGDLVGDNEVIRKMLIFLTFYNYWAKLITNNNNAFYSAKVSDSERCLAIINSRLSDAGYPELYAGNPYDWLFKWALNDENPLNAFRYYVGEIFAVKEEDAED